MSTLPQITNHVPLGPNGTTNISGTVDVDFSRGSSFAGTAVGTTVLQVKNLKPGQFGVIAITQDTTGGRSVNFGAGPIGPTVVALVSGPAPQLSFDTNPNVTTTIVLVGTDALCGSARVVSRTPGSPTGDVVPLSPTGSNDTANLQTVLNAGLVAELGPEGATYFLQGPIMLTASAANGGNLGGVRCKPRVTVRPVASWTPGAGSASDRTNAFFGLLGALDPTYSSTITTANQRGVNFLSGIVATAGIVAGDYLRCKSAPVVGSTLIQAACYVKAATIPSGTTLTTVCPTTLSMVSSSLVSSELPYTIERMFPVKRFFIEGGDWETGGKNIACLVSLTDCHGADGDIHFSGVKYGGFTLYAFDLRYCQAVKLLDNFSTGGSNGYVRFTSTHDCIVDGWSNNQSGAPYHAVGNVSCQIYSWTSSSDNSFRNVDAANVASVFHVQGGFSPIFSGSLAGRMLQPSIRYSRDAAIGGFGIACGAMFDGAVLNVPDTEFGFGYDLGNMRCDETYYDSTIGGAIAPGVGAYAYYYHDVYGTSIGTHTVDNAGNGSTGTLNGQPYLPCGGAMIRDNIGGTVAGWRIRNCGIGIATNGFGGLSWDCAVYEYDSSPGVGESISVKAAVFDAGAVSRNPRFGAVTVPQSGAFYFNASFIASPDWDWMIGHFESAYSPPYSNVVVAKDPGPVAFNTTEVAKLDPASPAGTRQIVVAGADDTGVVVVAHGTDLGLTSIKLICLPVGGPAGPCSVAVNGAVSVGDILTSEGGAGHKAKVNNAATLRQKIGTVVIGTAAAGTARVA